MRDYGLYIIIVQAERHGLLQFISIREKEYKLERMAVFEALQKKTSLISNGVLV